ncbi:hypothetical protein AAXB25_14460 [Paenibacillus lautus]|uniref:hypothetical protein n=1 Tax=Paenibacillus lautus TaxID=1401 RepID=UPI003D2DEA91
MKTLTEEQLDVLFLGLLIESLNEILDIQILTEEEKEKLKMKIAEVNEGITDIELFSQIIDLMALLLDKCGIRNDQEVLN